MPGTLSMDRSRFFQPFLLKVSFLLSLLVVLFLLISFVFLTPANIPLANLVQSVNAFLSWPNTVLEKLAHVSMHWVITAFCIQLFWFAVFYLALLLMSLFGTD